MASGMPVGPMVWAGTQDTAAHGRPIEHLLFVRPRIGRTAFCRYRGKDVRCRPSRNGVIECIRIEHCHKQPNHSTVWLALIAGKHGKGSRQSK